MHPSERPQVVCVQETHWTAVVAATFRTSDWEIYTSPTTDNKSAGLLTLIDKRLAAQCQVVYADPIPGRLQHIRLLQGSWTADVLNIYQKPYNSHPKAIRQAREIRLEVWEALRKLLHFLPARNTVVLLVITTALSNPVLRQGYVSAQVNILGTCRRIKPGCNSCWKTSLLYTSIRGVGVQEPPSFIIREPALSTIF